MGEGELKKRYVKGAEIYWIHECCPDERFTEEEAEAILNEENFVPASVLDEAKKEMPKRSDYTPEKSGIFYEYNYGVAWHNWGLKWFGEIQP